MPNMLYQYTFVFDCTRKKTCFPSQMCQAAVYTRGGGGSQRISGTRTEAIYTKIIITRLKITIIVSFIFICIYSYFFRPSMANGLYQAVMECRYQQVRWLLDSGLSLRSTNSQGRSLLVAALHIKDDKRRQHMFRWVGE